MMDSDAKTCGKCRHGEFYDSCNKCENESTAYTLYERRQIIINTDPQQRCYNGCFISSKTVWSDWKEVYSSTKLKDLEGSADTFKEINPTREYKIEVLK